MQQHVFNLNYFGCIPVEDAYERAYKASFMPEPLVLSSTCLYRICVQ